MNLLANTQDEELEALGKLVFPLLQKDWSLRLSAREWLDKLPDEGPELEVVRSFIQNGRRLYEQEKDLFSWVRALPIEKSISLPKPDELKRWLARGLFLLEVLREENVSLPKFSGKISFSIQDGSVLGALISSLQKDASFLKWIKSIDASLLSKMGSIPIFGNEFSFEGVPAQLPTEKEALKALVWMKSLDGLRSVFSDDTWVGALRNLATDHASWIMHACKWFEGRTIDLQGLKSIRFKLRDASFAGENMDTSLLHLLVTLPPEVFSFRGGISIEAFPFRSWSPSLPHFDVAWFDMFESLLDGVPSKIPASKERRQVLDLVLRLFSEDAFWRLLEATFGSMPFAEIKAGLYGVLDELNMHIEDASKKNIPRPGLITGEMRRLKGLYQANKQRFSKVTAFSGGTLDPRLGTAHGEREILFDGSSFSDFEREAIWEWMHEAFKHLSPKEAPVFEALLKIAIKNEPGEQGKGFLERILEAEKEERDISLRGLKDFLLRLNFQGILQNIPQALDPGGILGIFCGRSSDLEYFADLIIEHPEKFLKFIQVSKEFVAALPDLKMSQGVQAQGGLDFARVRRLFGGALPGILRGIRVWIEAEERSVRLRAFSWLSHMAAKREGETSVCDYMQRALRLLGDTNVLGSSAGAWVLYFLGIEQVKPGGSCSPALPGWFVRTCTQCAGYLAPDYFSILEPLHKHLWHHGQVDPGFEAVRTGMYALRSSSRRRLIQDLILEAARAPLLGAYRQVFEDWLVDHERQKAWQHALNRLFQELEGWVKLESYRRLEL